MKHTHFFGKRRWLLPFLLLLICALIIPVAAEESSPSVEERVPDGFSGVLDALPEELRQTLPEELFGESTEEVREGVQRIGSFSYLLRTSLSLLGASLDDCLALLASTLGLLLISAIVNALREDLPGEGAKKSFAFLASLMILLLLVREGWEGIQELALYFERLNALTAALLPLTGTLYAIGGNLTAGAASSAGLSIFMTLMEEVVGKSILPFCGICLAFAMISSLEPTPRIGSFLGTLKKNYTTMLAFLMMVLNTVLATQTSLSARGDSLAVRSARFAAGNLIPVIGGSVTELLRSVGVGLGYLRGTVGIAALLLILLTMLPTLLKLYAFRLMWQLSASFAELLGCSGERRLFEEFASLNGYLIAAVLICSSVLILSLVLLVRCTVALA